MKTYFDSAGNLEKSTIYLSLHPDGSMCPQYILIEAYSFYMWAALGKSVTPYISICGKHVCDILHVVTQNFSVVNLKKIFGKCMGTCVTYGPHVVDVCFCIL